MGTWGFDLAGRDTPSTPAQDFYEYANGTYLKKLEIPADRSRYGAFDSLNELSQDRMHAVLDKAAADTAATGEAAKVGALYRSFMDEAKVEALGAKPLAADLAAIRAAEDPRRHRPADGPSLTTLRRQLLRAARSTTTPRTPTTTRSTSARPAWACPTATTTSKPSFAAQKAKYQAYVAKMLTLAGWPEPGGQRQGDRRLGDRDRQGLLDPRRAARRRQDLQPDEPAELADLAPGFDWNGLPGRRRACRKVQRVVVAREHRLPEDRRDLSPRPRSTTLKAWQAFNLADSAAPYLSKRFDRRALRSSATRRWPGQPEQQPRWKRGVDLVDSQIGRGGRASSTSPRYFPPETKAKMLTPWSATSAPP